MGELDNLAIGKSYLGGGLVVGCLFATGEPSTKKWPVAHESEMAYFTAQHTCLSRMVAAIGSC